MKKISRILFMTMFMALFSISITSCSDEPTGSSSLAGTWHNTSRSEEWDEITITKITLVLNANQTGSVRVESSTEYKPSRASSSLHEEFRWAEKKDGQGNRSITFIHKDGDIIFGNNECPCTLAGDMLQLNGINYTR